MGHPLHHLRRTGTTSMVAHKTLENPTRIRQYIIAMSVLQVVQTSRVEAQIAPVVLER